LTVVNPQRLESTVLAVAMLITLVFVVSLVILWQRNKEQQLKYNFYFLVFLHSLNILVFLELAGLDKIIVAILYVISTLSISFVISVRSSLQYGTIMFALMVILELVNIITGRVEEFNYDLSIPDLIILIVLVFFFLRLINIGYSEIDYSYGFALNYARELEQLNRELDKKVEKRTAQLKRSFEKQFDSLHSSAVIGGITKSLLHDLATPLSSLRGAFSLLDDAKIGKADRESIDIAKRALEQAVRIIDNAKSIIKGNAEEGEFSPKKVVEMAVFASRGLIDREEVKVNIDINKNLTLTGYAEIFERIALNLIMNAVEELSETRSENRIIEIFSNEDDGYVSIHFKDNGNGIPRKYVDKIFDPDFTTKSHINNLGFGLPFVKRVIEEDFKGKINIETDSNSYTEVIVTIPKNEQD
jgi:signal transduction histidine kinase